MVELKQVTKQYGQATVLKNITLSIKKVVFIINSTNGNAKNLSLSFGFQFTGKMEHGEYYYALKL